MLGFNYSYAIYNPVKVCHTHTQQLQTLCISIATAMLAKGHSKGG